MNKYSPDQKVAIDIACSEDFDLLIITGAAGTGKSFIVEELREKLHVAVSAMTGAAAANIGGVTIDSLVKMNRNDYSKPRGDMKWFMKHMAVLPDIIIIDEFSMCGGAAMDFLDKWVIRVGKKKVIGIGDWAQASPVKDDWILEANCFSDDNSELELDDRKLRISTVALTTPHRHLEDPGFNDMLNRIRHGKVSDEDSAMLSARTGYQAPTPDQYVNGASTCTCLFATNSKADTLNTAVNARMAALGAPAVVLTADMVEGAFDEGAYSWAASANEKRIAGSGFAHRKQFALGSKIMITKNLPDFGLVNGDLGSITGFGDECITFHSERLHDEFKIEAMDQEFENARDSFTINGYPIRAAYGLTVHKAQGQTLTQVFIDMQSFYAMSNQDQESLHGLAYVALSRCRSLESVYLNVWESGMVHCSDAIRSMIA